MAGLQIQGAAKLDILARALRQAGTKRLEKELYSALNRATKPMRADAKKSAARKLPHAGGLNRRVAAARMSTRRIAGKDPGVRIVATGMDQLSLMDQGRIRHPVWGNRKRWVNQPIPEAEGWFTQPMQAGEKYARREIEKAIDSVAEGLARKL